MLPAFRKVRRHEINCVFQNKFKVSSYNSFESGNVSPRTVFSARDRELAKLPRSGHPDTDAPC